MRKRIIPYIRVIIGTEVNFVELQVNIPKGSMILSLLFVQEREHYVLYAGHHAPSKTQSKFTVLERY